MPTKIPPPSLPDKGKTITFHRFPHHIWHDQNLSLHERVVLCRVWSFLPRRCYLSYAQWAKELGCHRVTAVEILNKLVGKNKLTKSPAPEGSNEWHLVVSDYHLINEDDVASSPTLLPLVVTDYPPSSPTLPVLVVTDYPRRSLEDQLKDHKEDQLVADAPTPTCEYSLILGEPQDSQAPQESESVKEPIEISEAPPLPAAPPKAKKAVRPFEITDDERLKLLQYLREQAEVRGLIPKLEEDRLNLIVKETSNFWANKKKADWHRTVKNRIDQLFSWNRFSDWQAEAVGPSGLTITELNARLDYIFAWIHDTPVKPAVPFKDQADEDLATLVLISMFEENYEEVIKKKNIDDKKYYYKQFRELYEQAVKNERDREGRSGNIGSA